MKCDSGMDNTIINEVMKKLKHNENRNTNVYMFQHFICTSVISLDNQEWKNKKYK